jgi:hypothetical protein
MTRDLSRLVCAILWLIATVVGTFSSARADDQRFDLQGPTIRMTVTRNGNTLPIAQVPSLLPNDQLQVKADLPSTQSNHLLMIVAFLRSSTNEPPNEWFTRIETWTPQGQQATTIAVPVGAQSAVVFVAPETGGDYDSLRSVVKRNPGVFSRAASSLFKVSLEQQRIERYLSGMQAVAQEDDTLIAARSARLASALVLKPNADCFKQPVDDQVDCLMQTSDPMLLDNGSEQTASAAISTGASSDFINEASQNDGGVYSAYVGTVVDLVHLLGLLHTAQYRYIPAIALPDGPLLKTRLNAAPSFSNPKSVIVIALPPIRPSRLPDLHLAHLQSVFCLRDNAMVLPLRGSTSLYSTAFAHDLVIDFTTPAGERTIPLRSDVLAGGLLPMTSVDAKALSSSSEIGDGLLRGVLRGRWGFDTFDGPTLLFQGSEATGWKIVGVGRYVAGHTAAIQIVATATACLRNVFVSQPGGTIDAVPFTRSDDAHSVSLSLSARDKTPGDYTLHLFQQGNADPVSLALRVDADGGGHVDLATMNASGERILLTGTKLDQIAQIRVADVTLMAPQASTATDATFQLPTGPRVRPQEDVLVEFKDGRVQALPLASEAPSAILHVLSVQSSLKPIPGELPIELRSSSAIPLHSVLHFVLRSAGMFLSTDRIEIATSNGQAKTTLAFQPPNTSLILEDMHTVMGTIDLDKAFGESAFGALRVRMIRADGEPGEWVSLGTLVRRPRLTKASCEAGRCTLHGRELFLLQEISMTEDFDSSTPIPLTAAGEEFSFPAKGLLRPKALYCRLRDDPSAVAIVPLR